MKPTGLIGIPISLADAPSPVSQAQARSLGEQCADYWQKAAQGKLAITSTAAPIYKSTAKTPTGSAAKLPDGNCNTKAWTFCGEALKAAYTGGFRGTMPIYYTPRISCKGHGIASVGNGPIYMNGGLGVQMVSHELGHVYGLTHDYGLKMQGSLPFDPSKALATEYGDAYCVMGNGLSWLCPSHAQRLGIRTPKRIPRQTRTMFIKQTGQPDDTGAPRAVQITRGGPQGYTYQLSYQSPTNLDKPPVSDRIVIVRLVGGSASYYLAGLKAGKVWSDPLGGVSFCFNGETADGWAIVDMAAS